MRIEDKCSCSITIEQVCPIHGFTSKLSQQDARHEYKPLSTGVCVVCGRERNDYEYHFEPKAAPFDIPNRQPNLCSQCGQYQLMLYAIPSGKNLCGSCFNLWSSTPKAEEASEVKRPHGYSSVEQWESMHDAARFSFFFYDALEAGIYIDRLEQQVRELREQLQEAWNTCVANIPNFEDFEMSKEILGALEKTQ